MTGALLRLIAVAMMMLCLSTAVHAQLLPEEEVVQDDALQPLLDILEDEQARQRLIDALREVESDSPDVTSDGTPVTGLQLVATEVGETVREAVTEAQSQGRQLFQQFANLGRIGDVLTAEKWERIRQNGPGLLLTILVTFVAYRMSRRSARRMAPAPAEADVALTMRAQVFAAQVVLRVVSLVVAGIAGVIASLVFNFFWTGAVDLTDEQGLYLDAFAIMGMLGIGLSLVVSHDPRDMTFSRLSDRVERQVFRSSKRVLLVATYGIIAVVPITQLWSNFVIARSFRAIIVTLAALMAVWAILRIRRAINASQAARRAQLIADMDVVGDGEALTGQVVATTENTWNFLWPFLAFAYVATCYYVALSRPNQMFEFVGQATLLTVAGLALVMIAQRFLVRASSFRVPMTDFLEDRLPGFDTRLNRFLPAGSWLTAIAMFVGGVGLVLGGWGLFDLSDWLDTGGTTLMWRIASFAAIAMAVLVFWAAVSSWIDTRLDGSLPSGAVSSRTRTLLSLFRNVFTIALVVFGGMTALSELGIDIAPLLAGAGVIGLAIGFGAQKLVQDIITGIFIQLENAINEGDVITVAGISGTVESLTIRSVGMRDLSGTYHLIPFSAVDTVSNFMRRFGYHVATVGVAYESDLSVVRRAMQEAFDEINVGEMARKIIGPLESDGVTSLGDSSVNMRARIKTAPGEQWGIGRAYTEALKAALDRHNIEIPYPHREIRFPEAFTQKLTHLGDQKD